MDGEQLVLGEEVCAGRDKFDDISLAGGDNSDNNKDGFRLRKAVTGAVWGLVVTIGNGVAATMDRFLHFFRIGPYSTPYDASPATTSSSLQSTPEVKKKKVVVVDRGPYIDINCPYITFSNEEVQPLSWDIINPADNVWSTVIGESAEERKALRMLDKRSPEQAYAWCVDDKKNDDAPVAQAANAQQGTSYAPERVNGDQSRQAAKDSRAFKPYSRPVKYRFRM